MFLPLGNLLKNSINRAKIAPQMEATLAMDYFNKSAMNIWGHQVTKDIKPMYVKNRCLTVAVLSNLYAQEIRLREREIIDYINKEMKREVVERIRCLI